MVCANPLNFSRVPGAMKVKVRYTLSESNELAINYTAICSDEQRALYGTVLDAQEFGV